MSRRVCAHLVPSSMNRHALRRRLDPPLASRPVKRAPWERRSRWELRDGGFTLLELTVVVTIAAVLVAMIVPQFRGTQQSAEARSVAREITLLARLARSHAATSSNTCRLRFDRTARRAWLEVREPKSGNFRPGVDLPDSTVRWDPGVEASVRTTRESSHRRPRRGQNRDSTDACHFYADGTADGVTVVVIGELGDRFAITIDGVTARSRVEEASL